MLSSIHIGWGEETYFWWDLWTLFGQLIHFLGPFSPMDMGIPSLALVSECTWDSELLLRWEHTINCSSLLSSTIRVSVGNDNLAWWIRDKVFSHLIPKNYGIAQNYQNSQFVNRNGGFLFNGVRKRNVMREKRKQEEYFCYSIKCVVITLYTC